MEHAQLKYYLGEGTVDEVLEELGKFHNSDGGFGHVLELDIRIPNSSPICSSLAFQVLRELEVSNDHDMDRSMIVYFVNSNQPDFAAGVFASSR